MNILVVDDDSHIRESVAELLKDEGYNTFTAGEGGEALTILGEREIALVLTDLKMPGMNGLELIARLTKRYPHIPVIIMSGILASGYEFLLDSKYGIKLLRKPIEMKELLEKIQAQIESVNKNVSARFDLPVFLELLAHEQMDSLISVRHKRDSGVLYIKDGTIIDGLSKHKAGNRAVDEIIEWKNPDISISDVPVAPDISVQSLLQSRDYNRVYQQSVLNER